MAETDQKATLLAHMREWIQDLEQSLKNPKNTWKREQDLIQQLSEAKQRLRAIESLSNRSSGGQSNSLRSSRSDRPRSNFAVRSDRNREQVLWEMDDSSQTPSKPILYR